MQGHLVPAPVLQLPIAGGLPSFALYRRPAIGQPKQRLGIAAGLHEGEPLAVRHFPAEYLEIAQKNAVGGAFVVVGEAFAPMPDFMDAAGNLPPVPGAGHFFRARRTSR